MNFLSNRIPPPIVMLLFALLIWQLSDYSPMINFKGNLLIGTLIALCGLMIGFIAIKLFKKHSTTFTPIEPNRASKLITEGVYNFSRNPMYLGLLLILIGTSIANGVIIGIFIVPLFILYINIFQIAPEERALNEIFGEDFNTYKKRVRKWI